MLEAGQSKDGEREQQRRRLAELEQANDQLQRENEALFEHLCEGFALHELIVDAAGRPVDYRFLKINAAFEQLTGLRAEQVTGRRLLEVLPASELFWIETYGQVVQTGQPIRLERFSQALGKTFQVIAYRTSPGQFATLFIDVSARVQIDQERERLLQSSQDRGAELEALLESTQAKLALMDRDFNFLLVNSAYSEGSRHPRATLIGKNHFALFPDAENEAIFRQVRDSGQPHEVLEKPFEFPDQPERGTTYWNWTLVPIKSSGGEVRALVLSLLDVTEQVQARQQLLQLTVEARRSAAPMSCKR